jgi:hypothetical protein
MQSSLAGRTQPSEQARPLRVPGDGGRQRPAGAPTPLGRRLHPALIVLDPRFDVVQVEDVHNDMALTRALTPLIAVTRETGTHFLCVHHCSKPGRGSADQILGATALFGKVDTALRLRAAPGSQARLLPSVPRNGAPIPETMLRFDLATRTYRLGERRGTAEIARIGRAILTSVRQQTVTPTEESIDQDVPGKTAYKRKALRQLLASGEEARAGTGGKTEPVCYRLAELP